MEPIPAGHSTVVTATSRVSSLGHLLAGLALLLAAIVLAGLVPNSLLDRLSRVGPGGGDQFALVQLGSQPRDRFLVDTHSGRVWRSVCKADRIHPPAPTPETACSGFEYWDEMYVQGVTPTSSPVTGTYYEFASRGP